jgi:hypothetical protein
VRSLADTVQNPLAANAAQLAAIPRQIQCRRIL